MRLRTRWGAALPLLSAALLAGPPTLAAQELTVERLFGTPDFRTRSFGVQWTPDGESFAFVQANEAGGTDLWAEGIRTGKRTRLVEGATLLLADSARPIEVEEFEWSADRKKLLLFTNTQRVWRYNTKGTYYVYDTETKRLTPVSTKPGWQMFAKLNPAGDKVGFVRDNNLFVVDLETGAERQLTTDGSVDIINGTTDWVYEEELDLRDAWRWSPDGERIAFWRFDQSPIRTFHMIDELGDQYSDPIPLRYPKAGTPNSNVRLGVIELASGQTRWLDVEAGQDSYIPRMDFAESPTELVIQRLNRNQNQLDVLLGDVTTGRTRTLFSDTDSAWVDVDDELTWIRDGRQFLWTSERDGYNHIYLHDRSGKQVRQLTRGDFEVSAVHGVDERGGWVYFTAAHPSPMERNLYRVRLSGGPLERITPESGTHGINLSPNFQLYLDAHSTAGTPPTYTLRSVDGKVSRVMEDNARVAANLRQTGVRPQEFFQFTTPDGVELNGWMIKPRDFDPSKQYPVLMYVYGGPGSQTVTDAWGGSRYLWHQSLADRGYIVASVDNRGTGARGRDFKKVTYQDLGRYEVQDQIAAARHLASLPYIDDDRVGIWGWSYGGYMTLLSLLEAGDEVFKAGISVAPVTAWDLYDTVYTERFMRTPQENPEGYRRSAPITHAEKLESDLLLIHGTGDDNVHFQNTTQMVAALQEAGKQFDFMMYPNKTHSISGAQTQQHLFNLMTAWLVEHL